MRRFQMTPNGDYQEKMTDSLYNAGWRFDLDYEVLSYLKLHMTNREPRELLEGYLSEKHVSQLGSIQDELQEYSGPHSTMYMSSMIEALCVEGGTSRSVEGNFEMVQVDWNEVSGKYREIDDKEIRSEYARVREIARNSRQDEFNIITTSELAEELGL